MDAEDIQDFLFYKDNFQIFNRNAPHLPWYHHHNQHASLERIQFLHWMSDHLEHIHFLPEEYPPTIEWAMAEDDDQQQFQCTWAQFEFFMVGIIENGRILIETEPRVWVATANFDINNYYNHLDFYEYFKILFDENTLQ